MAMYLQYQLVAKYRKIKKFLKTIHGMIYGRHYNAQIKHVIEKKIMVRGKSKKLKEKQKFSAGNYECAPARVDFIYFGSLPAI